MNFISCRVVSVCTPPSALALKPIQTSMRPEMRPPRELPAFSNQLSRAPKTASRRRPVESSSSSARSAIMAAGMRPKPALAMPLNEITMIWSQGWPGM